MIVSVKVLRLSLIFWLYLVIQIKVGINGYSLALSSSTFIQPFFFATFTDLVSPLHAAQSLCFCLWVIGLKVARAALFSAMFCSWTRITRIVETKSKLSLSTSMWSHFMILSANSVQRVFGCQKNGTLAFLSHSLGLYLITLCIGVPFWIWLCLRSIRGQGQCSEQQRTPRWWSKHKSISAE